MTRSRSSRPLGAHMSIAGGCPKAIEHALSVQATALQIFTRNQKRWESKPLAQAEADAFRGASVELDYVCAHAGYLINLASPDESMRERSLVALLDELDRAERLGCDCLVLHPGSPKDDASTIGIGRVAKGLREALRATAGAEVRIALENTAGQGSTLGSTLQELGAILDACDRDPRLAVCIDTAHAFAAGYDLRTETGLAALLRGIEQFVGWERLRVLHLNDAKNRCGSRADRHEHIGQGQIGEDGFRRLLTAPELRHVPGIIETPKDGKSLAEDVTNLATLRRLSGGGEGKVATKPTKRTK
ncbi:MAG: deoxyribonuclease IV [Victivallales bacterium]|nr:deoxyribonuclease IV [Victivallales bacterium]